MKLYAVLYYFYSVIFICKAKPLYTKSTLTLPKKFITKYTIQFLVCGFFALYFSAANSQENTSQTLAVKAENTRLSEEELFKLSKSYKSSNRQKSIKLANEALQLSKDNKNHLVSAQAHGFLGISFQESKNIIQSREHFLQASILYKNLKDKHNHIMSSLSYVDSFIVEKRYDEANKIIDELLPIALQYEDTPSIAITFITKGDIYYQQKNYNDAITEYKHSLKYLSAPDKTVKKLLGETYKKIAQSYKRLKKRKETAVFYKKTLVIYTALRDQKLMARTLNTLAEAERYLGNYVIALDYSIRGLEIHTQLNDPEGRAKSLMGAGIIYRHIGRYEKSVKHIYEAHLYYNKVNDANGIGKTSNQMGLIYTRMKQFDLARSFYQRTIDLPEAKIELKTLASALREMAVIELNAGNYESAKVAALKAHKIYKVENEKSKETVTARVIGNIYRAQNDDVQAIKYYRESLSCAIEIDNKIYQIKALNALGEFLIEINNDEAVALLKRSLELSNQINDKYQKLHTYRKLRLVEKSQGNIAESLMYAEEEIALSLILQKEKEDNEFVLAKASLYSHKMEMELESLREKTKLDQLELVKKNNAIEIAGQARRISELELIKNKYANVSLACLLVVCLFVVLLIYRRFTDSNKRNKELNYLAARDPLTNCYNRRILFDFMNRDFSSAKLLGEYCIIMVDIDYFKAVNDNYGHSTGDKVLSAVADILQGSVRQSDIVARFGGEEFCIVLPGASQEKAMRIAENIRIKVETTKFDGITVTCSFGVTSIKFNAKSPSEIIEQADLALFKSKSLGRNQVILWEPSLSE
jgi:diguanylate cyclase (GGDEF)-like protein